MEREQPSSRSDATNNVLMSGSFLFPLGHFTPGSFWEMIDSIKDKKLRSGA